MQTDGKVDHWLTRQHDPSSGDLDQPLKLVATWDLIHVDVEEDRLHLMNSFSISESGAIGISCFEKPSLSVVYPNKDKATGILSRSKVYSSATFVKILGKEYLASACDEDGCLYLWDIESKTSKKVFDPKLPRKQRYKYMNIFRINNNTVGYGEVYALSDGSRRVFILNTDKREATLSSNLRLFIPDVIWDMCYMEVEGGIPCLLLCMPYSQYIMAVEMIGGKTRWEAGKEQMGERFEPWCICTDDDNTIYVADFKQQMIHLLSAVDGSVITSIDTRHYGIGNLVAIRIHDQHLYVEHYADFGYKYVISKFKREY